MNRDLEKGGWKSYTRKRKTVGVGWRGVGGGSFQPSHRSLSITDSQGKNYTENKPGAESAVHTSAAL